MNASSQASFPALVVRTGADRDVDSGVERLTDADLPEGDVTIEVACSSLNYKDALACGGHPGVVARLPHVPGIDAAGRVVASRAASLAVGDEVLVTGYDLGSGAWGGLAGRIRVPAEWPVPLPTGVTPEWAMTYGTAGFTAAQAVDALLHHGTAPEDGPLLVTGATGGVGVFAVAILAKLGFEVVAMSGKPDWRRALTELGAARIVGRDALSGTDRPMLKSQFAGGVDTVGGRILSALVRSTGYRGAVACCGLVAGHELPLTVYPFILRGVTLVGVDSAKCPREPRLRMWRQLFGPWSVELPDSLVTTIDLDGVINRVDEMLAGKVAGRTLVIPTSVTAAEQ